MRWQVLLALPLLGAAPVTAPRPLDPLFAADQGDTRAALLLIDGRVAAKRYAAPYDDRTRFISWSMAKTITAMLVGELVSDGRLQLDAPVPLVEWQRPGDPLGTITLRQMLNMASGVRHSEASDPVEDADTNQAEFVTATATMGAYALNEPLEAKPGSRFEYNTLTAILLAEVVTRTLTASHDPRVRAAAYNAFAEERLFKPAGVTSAFMEYDGAGTQVGGSLIWMTLDDWGRLGQLLLDGRGQDGSQVIAPQWLDFMRAPSPNAAEYGGQTWLNRIGVDAPRPIFAGAPADTVAMQGHLGQHVVAVPSKRIVVVRLGNMDERRYSDSNKAIGLVISRL